MNSLLRLSRLVVVAGLFLASRPIVPWFTWGGATSYWLHGLAHGGYGNFGLDWQTKTTSLQPGFDALLMLTYRYLPDGTHYLWLFLLVLAYVYSIMWIAQHRWENTPTFDADVARYCGLFCLLLYAHWHVVWAHVNNAQYHIAGVANQWLLPPLLGPQTFGVLLVLSIVLHLKHRDYLAVVTACIAALVHPTYLFAAACLTIAYMITAFRRTRHLREPAILGGIALVVVAPIVYYVKTYCGPTSPETFALAQDIIAKFRIPHHADPASWFRWHTVVLIVLVLWSIILERKNRLGLVMLVMFCASIAGTLLVVWVPTAALETLMPWRVSAVLVPVALCALLGRAWRWVFDRYEYALTSRRYVMICALAVVAAVPVIIGVRETRRNFREHDPWDGIVEYVRAHRAPGYVYLTPLPVDIFRLETGMPVFIDAQAHPFRDTEVVEWFARVLLVDRVYGDAGRDGERQPDDHEAVARPDCELLGRLLRCGITHVVDVHDTLMGACGSATSYSLRKMTEGDYSLLEVHSTGIPPPDGCRAIDDPAMATLALTGNYRNQRMRIFGSYGLP